ncbi:hypothetical protein HDU98_003551, partial [Podochytrium sp. JEL0797]
MAKKRKGSSLAASSSKRTQRNSSAQEEDDDAPTQVVVATEGGLKLDKFLRTFFADKVPSANHAAAAIKQGAVKVNGTKATKQMAVVNIGDKVSLAQNVGSNDAANLAETLGIHIYWENKDMAIVWKPAGTPVKATTADKAKSLESLLPALLNPSCANLSFLSTLETANSGLVICCKNAKVHEALVAMHNDGLISETFTVITQGNVGALRNLTKDDTFEIDAPIDGKPAVSLCTFLESSRTRNFATSYLSTLLVTPIQETAPVPLQPLHHLSATEHPVVSDCVALTGLEFEMSGKTVSVHLEPPKKFASLLKREQEAWKVKREADLKELKGIQGVEDKLDAGVPVAYILGTKEFCGRSFRVSPSVMIPKPGTETLIHSLLETHATHPLASPHILDLGTGSGCILISLLLSLPNSTGMGIDLSQDALAVARQNVALHNIPHDRVTLLESSFSQLPNTLSASTLTPKRFDYILTNPPYLPLGLWTSDRIYAQQKHEPMVAVVSGRDGLDAYRDIRTALRVGADVGWVKKGTWVFVEVNNAELAGKVKG